jgi:hypothetical protein
MAKDFEELWKTDLEFWNSGRSELATEVYVPDAVHREPGLPPMNGARQIAEMVAGLRIAFPDFKVEFTRILILPKLQEGSLGLTPLEFRVLVYSHEKQIRSSVRDWYSMRSHAALD